MTDYFAQLNLHEPFDREDVTRLAIHSCLDIHRVDWLRSYLLVDGSRMLCWYQALDAESVRFVVRQQGLEGASVWNAAVDFDGEPESVESDAAHLVVDIQLAASAAQDAESVKRGVIVALEGRYAIAGTLNSANGN